MVFSILYERCSVKRLQNVANRGMGRTVFFSDCSRPLFGDDCSDEYKYCDVCFVGVDSVLEFLFECIVVV